MKTLILTAIFAITAMSLSAQSRSFKVPGQWDKYLIITASHTGSMSGGSTIIMFTYDSCIYTVSSGQDAPIEKKFPLSAADRTAILKKMHDLKVGRIKGGPIIATQNDGWYHSIRFGPNRIEAGSGTHLSEKDMNKFVLAYTYLEDFARAGIVNE